MSATQPTETTSSTSVRIWRVVMMLASLTGLVVGLLLILASAA
ncbi:hypothetical protein [Williamsia maris]|uniref:Uncharacterized protein n=1 Tax=Williamsia maris TaxID=72806 RepID=A0ABT1HAG8_9NOCA|nr:hypothetical protein [Williamsia maris]MCP2175179.1 hypothetical protein [Williamsia maris]